MGGVQPSRRSNAPTAPGVLQASASRTIFRLYSTVNRRRVAFASTSITGPPRACSNALITLQSRLALDSKLPGGHCLTHTDREGWRATLPLSALRIAQGSNPQRDLPPGGPILAVPFEGHCLPDLEGLPGRPVTVMRLNIVANPG
jgi:hypothetical protein